MAKESAAFQQRARKPGGRGNKGERGERRTCCLGATKQYCEFVAGAGTGLGQLPERGLLLLLPSLLFLLLLSELPPPPAGRARPQTCSEDARAGPAPASPRAIFIQIKNNCYRRQLILPRAAIFRAIFSYAFPADFGDLVRRYEAAADPITGAPLYVPWTDAENVNTASRTSYGSGAASGRHGMPWPTALPAAG